MTVRAKQLALLLVLITACSVPDLQSPKPTLTQSITPVSSDSYEVRAWVDQTEPSPGQVVVLSGSLIKNGVYLNGLMMAGFWQAAGEESPSQHCYEFVNYQRGKCNIIVEGFPAGVFVPLTIEIKYQGMSFTAETGFTPRHK